MLGYFQVFLQVWLSHDNRTSKDRVWEQCPNAGSGGCLGHLVNGVQGQIVLPDRRWPLARLGAGHTCFQEQGLAPRPGFSYLVSPPSALCFLGYAWAEHPLPA